MTQFYTYVWLRADSTPYYVGKGSGRRAFQSQGHLTNRPKNSDHIIIFHTPSESAAFDLEVALIAAFGRKDLGTGCLRNMTAGGDDGYIRGPWTAERKQAQADRIKRQGLGGWNKGMKMPSISEKMKGNQHTKGKHTHTLDGNKRISLSKKGKPLSLTHRINLSHAHQGKPWSKAQRDARLKKKAIKLLDNPKNLL